MPPPKCLHAIPLRAIDSAITSKSSRCLSTGHALFFSTSSHNQYATPRTGGPAKGQTTLRLKKKGAPQKVAKPPEPGERKAMRKRIVLSNTNALVVNNVVPLQPEIPDISNVYALPAEQIDQLRAVEAFKPKQGWALYQRPAVLMRKEARSLGSEMDEISRQSASSSAPPASGANKPGPSKSSPANTSRKLICGEKSSGKSVLLLQAMAMAFQRDWIVINLPEGRELVNSHTAFSPIPGSKPVKYAQPSYTAKLLKQILTANAKVIARLAVTEKPNLSFAVKDDISLADLLEFGIEDPERAWPVFQVFWREITKANSSIDAAAAEGAPQRPPILLCLDNMAHIMVESKYKVLNQEGKVTNVHAHDLALVGLFTDCLSGAMELPNGGMVLAATSASDAPKAEAMHVGIALAETRQALAAGTHLASPNSSSSTKLPAAPASATNNYSTPYTAAQSLSPDKSTSPTALSNFWSPFAPLDTRVVNTLQHAGVIRLAGLDHAETTTLMQYWTRSGLNRGAVVPWLVDEARALSGGGVVGQLEQAVVRFLKREPMAIEGEAGGRKVRAC